MLQTAFSQVSVLFKTSSKGLFIMHLSQFNNSNEHRYNKIFILCGKLEAYTKYFMFFQSF